MVQIVISDQSIPLITSILDYRPDVSKLVFGSVYLFNDPESNYYSKIYLSGDGLHEEEITGCFYFTNLEDGRYYFINPRAGIVNVSSNLSEKASFAGIICVTQDGYDDLIRLKSIRDNFIYVITDPDKKKIINIFYNYMPLDPASEIFDKVIEIEGKLNLEFDSTHNSSEAMSGDVGKVYFTTDDNTIVLDGKVYGSSLPAEEKLFLESLYKKHLSDLLEVTGTTTKSTVTPGENIEAWVRVKYDDSPVRVIIESPVFFSEVSLGVYRYSVPVTSVGDSSISVKVTTKDRISKEVTIRYSCYPEIIYGWSPVSSLSDISELQDSQTRGPQSSASGEYTFTNTGVGYYYLLVPVGVRVPGLQATEGPIPVYFENLGETVSGYRVLRISDPQAPSSHVIKFQ